MTEPKVDIPAVEPQVITEIIERIPLVYIALAFAAGATVVALAMYLMAKGMPEEDTNE